MTREELIKHLEHLADYVKYSEDAPALREVIEMLKCSEMPNGSEERTEERTETHACDCISRQAAIDAVLSVIPYDEYWKEQIEKAVANLPPAQPDLSEYSNRLWRSAYERGKRDAQPEQQWIPCKESMPTKNGAYLVSGRWASGKESVGDCDYSKEDGYFHTAWNFDVLAWRELPEPYEGGNDA